MCAIGGIVLVNGSGGGLGFCQTCSMLESPGGPALHSEQQHITVAAGCVLSHASMPMCVVHTVQLMRAAGTLAKFMCLSKLHSLRSNCEELVSSQHSINDSGGGCA
jgi:hypothetical protein